MPKNLSTFNGLSNALDSELAWRRKELLLIKNKIPNSTNSLQKALLRSALPFLYAHWEGFVKITMSYYLEYVSRKYLKHKELQTKFISLSLKNKLGELNVNDFEVKTKVIDYVFSEYDKQSNIPKKNIINTKSNLRYGVLQEILYILDLEDSHIESKKELIDDLVDTRNFIAHGEYEPVDYTSYINMHDDIIALMEYLKTKIENNAILEKYKMPTLRVL